MGCVFNQSVLAPGKLSITKSFIVIWFIFIKKKHHQNTLILKA